MRLVLQGYGLKKFNTTFMYVGFSKCGPSLNGSKFYKDDNGVLMGYEEVFDRKSFTI
jgi:hypothetical protein